MVNDILCYLDFIFRSRWPTGLPCRKAIASRNAKIGRAFGAGVKYGLQMGQPRQMRNLALIGFMATGKSSVGRWLARRLGFEFVDTDTLIETRCKRRISEIFEQEGEAKFREYERDAVRELAGLSRAVISTGGGLAANEDSLERLKEHCLIVCLWAGEETIWRRASHNTHRPLLQDADPRQRIQTLLSARTPFYRQADVMVTTDFRSVKQVAEHVLHEFMLVTGESGPVPPVK